MWQGSSWPPGVGYAAGQGTQGTQQQQPQQQQQQQTTQQMTPELQQQWATYYAQYNAWALQYGQPLQQPPASLQENKNTGGGEEAMGPPGEPVVNKKAKIVEKLKAPPPPPPTVDDGKDKSIKDIVKTPPEVSGGDRLYEAGRPRGGQNGQRGGFDRGMGILGNPHEGGQFGNGHFGNEGGFDHNGGGFEGAPFGRGGFNPGWRGGFDRGGRGGPRGFHGQGDGFGFRGGMPRGRGGMGKIPSLMDGLFGGGDDEQNPFEGGWGGGGRGGFGDFRGGPRGRRGDNGFRGGRGGFNMDQEGNGDMGNPFEGGRGGPRGRGDFGFRGGRGGFNMDQGGMEDNGDMGNPFGGGRGGPRGRGDFGGFRGGRGGFNMNQEGNDDNGEMENPFEGGNRGRGFGRGGEMRGGRGRGGFEGGRKSMDKNMDTKPGDWICPKPRCGNNNFARRTECHKCGTPKGGETDTPTNEYGSSSKRFDPPKRKESEEKERDGGKSEKEKMLEKVKEQVKNMAAGRGKIEPRGMDSGRGGDRGRGRGGREHKTSRFDAPKENKMIAPPKGIPNKANANLAPLGARRGGGALGASAAGRGGLGGGSLLPSSVFAARDSGKEDGIIGQEFGDAHYNESRNLGLEEGSFSEQMASELMQFDAMFQNWEAGFVEWKINNKNNPDEAYVQSHLDKMEAMREQLISKRQNILKSSDEGNAQGKPPSLLEIKIDSEISELVHKKEEENQRRTKMLENWNTGEQMKINCHEAQILKAEEEREKKKSIEENKKSELSAQDLAKRILSQGSDSDSDDDKKVKKAKKKSLMGLPTPVMGLLGTDPFSNNGVNPSFPMATSLPIGLNPLFQQESQLTPETDEDLFQRKSDLEQPGQKRSRWGSGDAGKKPRMSRWEGEQLNQNQGNMAPNGFEGRWSEEGNGNDEMLWKPSQVTDYSNARTQGGNGYGRDFNPDILEYGGGNFEPKGFNPIVKDYGGGGGRGGFNPVVKDYGKRDLRDPGSSYRDFRPKVQTFDYMNQGNGHMNQGNGHMNQGNGNGHMNQGNGHMNQGNGHMNQGNGRRDPGPVPTMHLL